jgi:hypothetical protein
LINKGLAGFLERLLRSSHLLAFRINHLKIALGDDAAKVLSGKGLRGTARQSPAGAPMNCQGTNGAAQTFICDELILTVESSGSCVGWCISFELGTENHTQQEGPESVLSNAVHAQEDGEDRQNELCPRRESVYDFIYSLVRHNGHAFRKQTILATSKLHTPPCFGHPTAGRSMGFT